MTTSLIEFEGKSLDRLPHKELGRHLMRLPPRKRLEAIVQREDAELVVRAMSSQDFYLSVKEIGLGDALSLLNLAKVEQLNFIFDFEWWEKDHIRAATAIEWLEILSRAGDGKLLAWLEQADFELLVSLFKKWIVVTSAPDDVDPLEARDSLPKNTLDDQYFWDAYYPQYESFIMHLLSLIFETHYGFYSQLVNSVIWASQLEMEEDAYRFARGRLEDHAIPDYYDSLEIYRTIAALEMASSRKPAFTAPENLGAPSFALALLPDKNLLALALGEIQDSVVLESVQVELASLANKVIVADQLPPDNPEGVRQAVDKVGAYVNLGLDLQSDGKAHVAAEVLKEVFVEQLFRLGHTHLTRVKTILQSTLEKGWLSRWPAGLKCLDPQWFETAQLMLQRTPRLMRFSSGGNAPSKEDLFRDQQDLLRGKHFADMIAGLEPLFDALHVEPQQLQDLLWKDGQIGILDDVTVGIMIWTSAAMFQRTGKWEVVPLPVSSWPALHPMLEPGILEGVIRGWLERALHSPSSRALAEAYLAPIFRAYAEEMAPFCPSAPPEAHLVKFFAFTGSNL